MPYTDTSPPSVYVANRGGAPNPPSILKNGLNVAPASGPPTTKRVTFDDTKRVREFAPDPVVLDDLLAPGFSGLTVNAKKLTPGVVKTEDTRLATHDSIESTDSDGPAGADDFGDLM